MATVLIVGASRGIGLEFVRQYTAEGNRVIATHRKPEAGATLRELGAKPAALDMLDEGAVLEFSDKMAQEKLDIVVINAGVIGPRGKRHHFARRSRLRCRDAHQRACADAIDSGACADVDCGPRKAGSLVERDGIGLTDDEHLQLAVPRKQGGAECGAEGGEPRARTTRCRLHRVSSGLGAYRYGRRQRRYRRQDERRRHAPGSCFRQRFFERKIHQLQRRATVLVATSYQRRLISSGSSFEAAAGYSRAVVDGDYVHVSGTTGFDYAAMTIEHDVAAQAHQCFRNVSAALGEAGCTLDDVVRVRYYLTDVASFERLAPIFGQYFAHARPAATAIVCGLVDARMKIEIEVTARVGSTCR